MRIFQKSKPWPLLSALAIDPRFPMGSIKRPAAEKWVCIAITPRCGSTAICSILSKTRRFGRPEEVLNPRGPAQWLLGTNKVDSLQDYFDLLSQKIGTNGFCSFKTGWADFEPFLQSGAASELLKHLSWTFLRRRDIDKQAQSLARARKTGTWHVKAGERQNSNLVDLSSREVSRAKALLLQEYDAWDQFFDEQCITPFVFDYEDLLFDLTPLLTRFSQLAGLPETAEIDWSASDFVKLSEH
jgi:LPS sulfotransferase NodH